MFRGIVLFMLLIASVSAKAEYCWMIGCKGDIGYIYIPYSQIEITPETKSKIYNGDSYELDTSRKLFREFGLPAIGSTVTLNSQTPLLSYAEIINNAEIKKQVGLWIYEFEKQEHKAYLRQYNFNAGFPMRAGARLKIISYLSTGSSTLQGYESLFALVMVISDE